jgi:hypothetical protein
MLGTRPPGGSGLRSRRSQGQRREVCVTSPGIGHDCSRSHLVRCSRSSPKSDFLVLIGQIQGAHESAEQHPMGRDPSGAPKTVQRACGDPHRVGSGTHGRSRPWSSQRPQARLWSREICPGLSGIWCSGPGVRRIRFHDLRHTCACCFWRSVRRPCADGRAGPFSAFDHHGFCTPM